MTDLNFDYAEHFGRPAVRRGAVYCAPWCGANCTWAAFQIATTNAKKLAKSLGKEWKPVVWENLGWHYKVTNGILEVTTNTHMGKTRYTAWCQSSPQVIGDSSSTARLAVKSLGNKMAIQFAEQLVAFRALEEAYITITGKNLIPTGIKRELGA